MSLEKLAYIILAVAAAAWTAVAIFEIQWATWEGILTFLTALGLSMLLFKAIRDRLGNSEDDHYNRTVER